MTLSRRKGKFKEGILSKEIQSLEVQFFPSYISSILFPCLLQWILSATKNNPRRFNKILKGLLVPLAYTCSFLVQNVVYIHTMHTAVCILIVSWESEATPSATPVFKRAYKISHPPWLSVSWIDLPSFASSSKIWPNFSNIFSNLKFLKKIVS